MPAKTCKKCWIKSTLISGDEDAIIDSNVAALNRAAAAELRQFAKEVEDSIPEEWSNDEDSTPETGMDAQLRDMVVAVIEAGDSDAGMVEILDEWATMEDSTDVKEILLDECVEEMQVENLLDLNAADDDDEEFEDSNKKPAAISENDRKEMSQVSDAMEELLVKIDSSGHPALGKASVQMGDAIYNIRKYLREKKLEEKQKKTGKQVSLTAFFRPKP
jgi:hypothetical protein